MRFGIAALVLGLAGGAVAQQHQHHHGPYAGWQQREIKSLSKEQIADLQAGRGMGLALAAELNGYPGPLHVLEFADKLQLTAEQKELVRRLFEAMKLEAVAVGEKLIVAEKLLNQEFASGQITVARLSSITQEIGERQGELRAVHLKYHLTTAELLSSEQREQYRALRGYQ